MSKYCVFIDGKKYSVPRVIAELLKSVSAERDDLKKENDALRILSDFWRDRKAA